MQGHAAEKIKGGKLVRVTVDYEPHAIRKVLITGDFFLHPEDTLELIEQSFTNLPLALSEEDLVARVQQIVNEKEIIMVGITSEAIAKLVKQVISND